MDEISIKGQTIIEYSLVLGIIVTVAFVMQPMVKRAGQGMIKLVADQIGNQVEADQRAFYKNSILDGHMEFANLLTQSEQDSRTLELSGATNYLYNDRLRIGSVQQSNLGFTEDPEP